MLALFPLNVKRLYSSCSCFSPYFIHMLWFVWSTGHFYFSLKVICGRAVYFVESPDCEGYKLVGLIIIAKNETTINSVSWKNFHPTPEKLLKMLSWKMTCPRGKLFLRHWSVDLLYNAWVSG